MSSEKKGSFEINICLGAPIEYAQRSKEFRKSEDEYSGKINRKEQDNQKHWFRTEFMRDRDKISFSQAFRRLSGKTQIFFAHYHDHARTRLTHTLEVAQLARTVAKSVNLDVDLAEAIALGHDLGHTPFGHVGEESLNYIMNQCDIFYKDYEGNELAQNLKGFKHNLQGVRVVDDLERSFKAIPGLNLTNFTLFGIREHTKSYYKECKCIHDCVVSKCCHCDEDFSSKTGIYSTEVKNPCIRRLSPVECHNNYKKSVEFYLSRYDKHMKIPEKFLQTYYNKDKWSWSFEAYVVNMCDEIAQRHHDLEDGLETKIMSVEEVKHQIHETFYELIKKDDVDSSNFRKFFEAEGTQNSLAHLSRFIVSFYLRNLIEGTIINLKKFTKEYQITSNEDWVELYPQIEFQVMKNEGLGLIELNGLKPWKISDLINFPKDFVEADEKFHKYLKNKILNSFQVQRMDGIGSKIVKKLFQAYISNPQQLPDMTIYSLYKKYDQPYIDEKWNKFKYCEQRDDEVFTRIASDLRENRLNIDRHNKNFIPFLFRTISDYISGMTDNYASKEYQELFGNSSLF